MPRTTPCSLSPSVVYPGAVSPGAVSPGMLSPRALCPGLLCLATLTVGCGEFLRFDLMQCGNGIIEPACGEDCDGLPARSRHRCGEVGTATARRLI